MPSHLHLDTGRVVLLWQPPSAPTLARLQRDYPRVPILVGRFEPETPVATRGLTYYSAADFFPLRSLIDFELAFGHSRTAWQGPPEPTYQGMSLIDGNLVRFGRWSEFVCSAAMLIAIRGFAGRLEVVSDWIGAQLAGAVGLPTRRLRRANLADPNWPPRRWLREHLKGERGWLRRIRPDAAFSLPSSKNTHGRGETDVAILAAGWVEPRLLNAFPVEALVREGCRCVLWVHRHSDALDELVKRTGVRCERIDFPQAAADGASIERNVARWVREAAQEGYFAPLRGKLACRVARLMTWPRWAPKLVSMHRLLTTRLVRESPRLLIAPAEKDWSAYCGHHAARRLGITSVGIKHGIWPPGSQLERFCHRHFFPTAATHVLAYTPGDAAAYRRSDPVCEKWRRDPSRDREGAVLRGSIQSLPDGRGSETASHTRTEGETSETVIWRGHPRVDKQRPDAGSARRDAPLRILIGARGVGPGQPMSLRRHVLPWNLRLIEALSSRLGEQVRVRLHPWDSPDNYPAHVRRLMLPAGRDLDEQLAEHEALAATYSMIAIDAAAAGKPVFLWDYAQLDLDRSEIAIEGGAVVSPDLDALSNAVVRFVNDPTYRQELRARAARFPRYLRETLPGADGERGTMTAHLARWLSSLAGVVPEPISSGRPDEEGYRVERHDVCVETP